LNFIKSHLNKGIALLVGVALGVAIETKFAIGHKLIGKVTP
jgi:hypothetical protein